MEGHIFRLDLKDRPDKSSGEEIIWVISYREKGIPEEGTVHVKSWLHDQACV